MQQPHLVRRSTRNNKREVDRSPRVYGLSGAKARPVRRKRLLLASRDPYSDDRAERSFHSTLFG